MENHHTTPAPGPASTVVLVRETEGRLEVYLLRRSPESSFFPGNYVFPGGGVSSLDGDAAWWKPHVDLPMEEVLRRFGVMGTEEIVAYGVSAIRETFEEAGVLLARKKGGRGEDFEKSCQLRISEGLPRGWLKEWVERDSWLLGFSMLARWSHWVTPEAMPRRFDTRFFVAFMPPGQTCSPDRKEMTHGVWLTPEQALSGNLRREIPLSPPTLITLNELLPFASAAGLKNALETRSWGEPLLPVLKRLSRGAVIIEPWDPMHGKDFEMDASRLEDAVAPIGEPFSRIWLWEGIWRPIRSR